MTADLQARPTGEWPNQRERVVVREFLHAEPGRVQRLLDQHVRRFDGGCTCSYGTYIRWPCSVATLALRVRRVDQTE